MSSLPLILSTLLLLSGRVLDPEGHPIAGATVRALALDPAAASEPISTESGSDGTFSFPDARGAAFRVRVEARDFAPWNAPRATHAEPLEARLSPGEVVSGRIVDAASGKGIAGARVRLTDPGARGFPEEASLQTITDEAGVFRFAHAPEGELEIAAVAKGRAEAKQSLGAETRAAGLVLHPGARVAGQVRTTAGAPVKGATVRIAPHGAQAEERRTGADGAFVFEGLRAGPKQWLTVEHPAFLAPQELPLQLVAGRDRDDLRVTLVAGAAIRFRLKDSEQRPVDLAGLTLWPEGDEGAFEIAGDEIELGSEGRLTARQLLPGVYVLEVRPAEGQYVLRERVTLVEGKVTDLGDLEVRKGNVLSGIVVDRTGQAVADAVVSVVWREGTRDLARQIRSDGDGRFRIRGLGEGTLTLTVTSRWHAKYRDSPVKPDASDLEIVLERAGAIRGTVVTSDGKRPGALRLRALLRKGEEPFFADEQTKEIETEVELDRQSGEFTLLHVKQEGSYTVEAIASGYAPARSAAVRVTWGRVADAGEILLERGLTLHGRVLRAEDDSAVAGAEVCLEAPGVVRCSAERMTVSDGDGEFSLESLSPGTFALRVEHADYAPAEVLIDLSADHAIEVRLSVGGEITGTVRDRDSQPVPGVRIVLIRGLTGSDIRSMETDADGKYGFSRLAAGSYSIGLTMAKAAVPLFKPASVAEGETVVVDFGDRASIRLSGRVQSAGEALPHVKLAFIRGDGMVLGDIVPAESDASGRYEVGLAEPGPYAVSVMSSESPGRTRSALVRIEVPDEPEVVQDITVESGRLSGRVMDAERRPIAGVAVHAWPAGDAESFDSFGDAHTQEDGTFEILGLRAGAYTVGASAEGFAPENVGPLTIGDGSPSSVEIVLERGRSVQGLVLDPRGNPVGDARVSISASGVGLTVGTSAITDAQGRFRANVPHDGAVNVLTVAEGWAPAWIGGWSGDPDSPEGPTIVLSEGGRLRVEVLDGAGRPVAGVVVLAAPRGDSWSWLHPVPPLSTDTVGRGMFEHLSPGGYLVHALQSEKTEGVAVDVSEGAEASARIVLGR